MNISAYFLYSDMCKLPDNSIEKAMANLAIKNSWHQIFDYTPRFLELINRHDNNQVFELFLEWMDQNELSMDWMAHVHMLNWLLRQDNWKSYIDDNMIKEFLVAAVMRWSLNGLEHFDINRIVLVSKHLPEVAVCLSKSNEATVAGKVSLLRISKLPVNVDVYALLETYDGWNEGFEWYGIPVLN